MENSLSINSCTQNKSNSVVKKQQKPNIICILADDMGYGDVGVYGKTKLKRQILIKWRVKA
jgi:hypothetical protein